MLLDPSPTSTEMQVEREKAAKERKTNEHFRAEMMWYFTSEAEVLT